MKFYITNISDWPNPTIKPRNLPDLYKIFPEHITVFEGTEAEIYKQLFHENWIANDSISYLEKE